jgi:hypothetical protein
MIANYKQWNIFIKYSKETSYSFWLIL